MSIWLKDKITLMRWKMKKEIEKSLDMKALDEKELQYVYGGAGKKMYNTGAGSQPTRIACCKCHRAFPADISKTEIKCPYCSTPNTFSG